MKKLLLLPVIAVALTHATLESATFDWDGGGATANWATAANWDPDGTPTFNNVADLVFNVEANTQTWLGFTNRTVRSLTFGSNIDTTFSVSLGDTGNAARNLTLQADSGNASITVASGSTGAITIGNGGVSSTNGNLVLGSHLDVTHNGSGELAVNRPITGAFDVTKSGTGTMRVIGGNTFSGALNINQGVLVASAAAVNTDIDTASGVNINGGTLNFRFAGDGTNKSYTTAVTVGASGGTIVHENTGATASNVIFSGTNSFALNGDVTLRTVTSGSPLSNGINISRAITGAADIFIQGYNNISASGDTYGVGRVSLSGDNSGWSGNLVISRGTALFGGNLFGGNVAGTGDIIIGTTADAFGAGLTFTTTAGSGTFTYANDIIVRSGGFRSIKGGNTAHSYQFNGDVLLEGSLNVDHTLSAGQAMTFTGDISGTGGLSITRAAGSAATSVRLTGTNTYAGATTVNAGASLILDGSVTSNVNVAGTARFGGNGTVNGDLTLSANAQFIFSLTSTLDVTGSVSLDNSFSLASLVTAAGGAIDWSTVNVGTYTLIGLTVSDFSNIQDFGFANKVDIGDGKFAYFDGGSLNLVVVPEPGTWALLSLGLGALAALRRRRS